MAVETDTLAKDRPIDILTHELLFTECSDLNELIGRGSKNSTLLCQIDIKGV